MKIRVEKDLLQKKLSNIQGILDKGSSSLQILNHFLFNADDKEGSFIMATDLETAYKESIEVEIEEEGKICIHGKKFFEIIKEMEGTIYLEVIDENWLKITSGKSLIRLACLPHVDFPAWPDLEGQTEISITMADLSKVIERTVYAVKESDARFFLKGLLFKITTDGTLTVVGTDTHRLSLVKNPIEIKETGLLEDSTDILISKKAVLEIRKTLSNEGKKIDITIGKNHIRLKIRDTELLTRKVEGTFPNYENSIPESFEKELIANRNEFLKSLRKVSVMSKNRGYAVKMDIDAKSMTLSASDPDYGEAVDEINVNFTSKPFSIAFNAQYLIEALETMTGERIIFKFIDPLKASMLLEEGMDDYKCVIMPLRA